MAVTLLAASALAADNQTLWKEAADNYDQGNYNAAVASYSRLLERGFINPELYYNLGNSYFKAGELGHAIWSYRRALKLDPGFEQARSNLAYIRTFNTDQIASRGRGFVLDIWDFASGLLTANGYLALLMLAWWTLAAIIIWRLWRGGSAWQYYLLILPALIIIFSTASAARRINDDRLTRWGVLAQKSVDIREGPGEEFNKVEVGHEGLEFKILGTRENSYLIELDNGLKGWVDKKAVLEI